MALFFDQSWFDRRLSDTGKTHEELASAMGVPLIELAAIWKDQRELSVEDVSAMARVLSVDEKQIANRAGISTPIPGEEVSTKAALVKARFALLENRIKALETQVAELLSKNSSH